MQYHLILTEKCNLHCHYCGGTRFSYGVPLDPTYSIEQLSKFISKDSDAVIGFYGGEPLLASKLMYDIINKVPAKAFTLQTNGILSMNMLKMAAVASTIDKPIIINVVNVIIWRLFAIIPSSIILWISLGCIKSATIETIKIPIESHAVRECGPTNVRILLTGHMLNLLFVSTSLIFYPSFILVKIFPRASVAEKKASLSSILRS